VCPASCLTAHLAIRFSCVSVRRYVGSVAPCLTARLTIRFGGVSSVLPDSSLGDSIRRRVGSMASCLTARLLFWFVGMPGILPDRSVEDSIWCRVDSVYVSARHDVVFHCDREIGTGAYRLTRARDVGLQSARCSCPPRRIHSSSVHSFAIPGRRMTTRVPWPEAEGAWETSRGWS
jgi:hypothetical protein